MLSGYLFKFHTVVRNFIALLAFLSRKHHFRTSARASHGALATVLRKHTRGPDKKIQKKSDQKEETEISG